MKNVEKLELLKNKMVEYISPTKHYKGFLYKSNNDNFYIKVVEVFVGEMIPKQKLTLSLDEYENIIHADKPKLMKVTTKSWHYRLLKYVMKNSAPTPKDLQNGCPYFWLLMFSILVLPIVSITYTIAGLFTKLNNAVNDYITELSKQQLLDLNDEEVYDLYDGDSKLGFLFKYNYKNKSRFDVIKDYIYDKYGITPDSIEFNKKYREIQKKWDTWNLDQRKINSLRIAKHRKEAELRRKRYEKIENKIDNLIDKFKSLFSSITNHFYIDFSKRNDIIKTTKRIVGTVVTLSIIVMSYFGLNLLVLGLSYVINFIIANIGVISHILGILILSGLVVCLIWLIAYLVSSVVDKYNGGIRLWYIDTLLVIFYYPFYYAGIGIFHVLLIPLKFILFDIIWLKIIVNISLFIWRGMVNAYKFVLGSTGIFGEYFSASYTDYCPGIEWVDFDDDEE